MKDVSKRIWAAPHLTTYGDVEKLTGDSINKRQGSGDAVTSNGRTVTTNAPVTRNLTFANGSV